MNGTFAQLGYVTKDLEAACAHYRANHGIDKFLVLEPPAGVTAARAALAYKNGIMIELIEPAVGAEGVYGDYIPRQTPGVALHHIAYVIDDLDELKATIREYEKAGYAIPVNRDTGRGLWLTYIDTRADLGHYTELLVLFEEGHEMFAATPVN